MDENGISRQIVGAAIEVHRCLGPGLMESVYRQCLAHELSLRGFECREEVALGAGYKGLEFDTAYQMDLLVEDKVIIELKVVEKLLPVHEAQLLSYLKLSDRRLGMLLNFHVPVLRNGVKRVVNRL
ncbi:MAG: GxxExxY protein [Pseudomonadota bacterium]